MAGVLIRASSPEVSLSAATVKTVVQITAPANQRVLVREISVSFKGIVNTDGPVLVEVLRQSTAGTGTSLTIVKRNSADTETIQSTALHSHSAEPTAGDVLIREEVHPQGGALNLLLPDKFPLVVPGGGRLGIRCTAPQAQTVVASIGAEE